MKTVIASLILSLSFLQGQTQDTLTLDTCYARAEKNYPLIRQRALIAKSRQYSVENAAKGHLPQIQLAGQATYQSDVTEVPINMPGTEIEPLSKDQYKVYGEVAQVLYNGGLVRQQKAQEESNALIEEDKVEVELYQIRNRINELYFGVLLIQEQLLQSGILKKDLEAALRKAEASVVNGAALKSSADVLRAELLTIDQRIIEQQSNARAFRDMLELFTGQDIHDQTSFSRPSYATAATDINRAELRLYDRQKRSVEISRSMLAARKRPRVELFVQGGYGRPALNMLENDFNFYGLGGIRFTWAISGFYTFRNEKQLLDIRQQSYEIQKETFLFNTNVTLQQQNSAITRLQKLIASDREIIALRNRIRNTASAQLEHGTITSTDYIREANAEDQARQNLALHEIQLLQASHNHRFTTGGDAQQ